MADVVCLFKKEGTVSVWIKSLLQLTPPWCYVLAGASLGAVARYVLTTYTLGGWVSIALVNLLGCLAFGLFVGLCLKRGLDVQNHPIALFGLTGFCGAFTTFSSYVFNLHSLLRQGQVELLLLNIAGQHILGVGLFICGVWLTNRV
jgi:fluoride exporter